MHRFSLSSDLPISIEEFHISLTMNGVNRELSPFIKMTAPEGLLNQPILRLPTGQHLFHSWILLLGLLPIDRHAFLLESTDPFEGFAEGFAERSSSIVNSLWRHERKVTATASGCTVSDIVEFQCRAPLLGYLLKPVYRGVFALRHRKIRSIYTA